MNLFYSQNGIDDVLTTPSEESMCRRVGNNYKFGDNGGGFMDFLFFARNVTRTKNKKEKINQSLIDFMTDKGVKIPNSYAMANLNMTAMYKSFMKYDRGQPTLNAYAFRLACSWTETRYLPIMGGSQVLSTDEALEDMDKTTSCGYPWNILYKNKKDFLEKGNKNILEDYWDRVMLSNYAPLWKVAQKGEMLPMEKIKAGKVRTFTAAPIEFSVACNRLFLDQNQRMNNNNVLANPTSSSFVGGSKMLGGWDKLYHWLTEFSNIAFELDESSYDASLFQEIFSWLCDFRYRCIDNVGLTAEEKLDLRARCTKCYESIVHSLCLLEDGVVCMKHTGNPSGSPNTINDNTLALDVLFNYAWIVSCERQGRNTDFSDFNRNVRSVLNGDDNDYVVSYEAQGILNPQIVQEIWSNIGVITKTPSMAPRLLEECQFLSSSFHYDNDTGKYYPRPDYEKTVCSLIHASSVDDIRWHYLRAAAIRIDSFWDEELRNLIQSYLGFLLVNHKDQLSGEIKDIKWENIQKLFVSDAAIRALYSGKQTSASSNLGTMLSRFHKSDNLLEFMQSGLKQSTKMPVSVNRCSDEVAPLKITTKGILMTKSTKKSVHMGSTKKKKTAQRAAKRLEKKNL